MIGGVEGILGAHARLLRQSGHDVTVVTGRGEGIVVPELDSRHPDVQTVTEQLARGRRPRVYQEILSRLAADLRTVLRECEVVVAHNVLTMPFNLPAAEALVGSGRPLVAWTHDLAWNMERYRDFHRAEHPWRILGTAQPGVRYVAVSRARAQEIGATFGLRRVDTVPNGIDALEFAGVSGPAAALARRAGMLDADPLVLVPTRITPRKRLELAIEVAAELRRRFPELKLAISGPLGAHSPENESYARHLEELAERWGCSDSVVFMRALGSGDGSHPVRDRDVPALYRLADLVLLPSESEGFGLVILEAGLARAPVVCADLQVLREVGGGGTWRYPAGAGAAEVAAVCARALTTRQARLRRRARRRDWSAIRPRIEEVLRDAARG